MASSTSEDNTSLLRERENVSSDVDSDNGSEKADQEENIELGFAEAVTPPSEQCPSVTDARRDASVPTAAPQLSKRQLFARYASTELVLSGSDWSSWDAGKAGGRPVRFQPNNERLRG